MASCLAVRKALNVGPVHLKVRKVHGSTRSSLLAGKNKYMYRNTDNKYLVIKEKHEIRQT